MITAVAILIITYLFTGLRQIPRVHIDRPAGALVDAVLMVVLGVLTVDQAFAAVDMHTLLLHPGMMIMTVYLRLAGFFELMADRILSLSRTPLQLLVFMVFISLSSGLLSALFVNDTICLLYTPIIRAARQTGFGCSDLDRIEVLRDPMPVTPCTDFELPQMAPVKFSFSHVCRSITRQALLLARGLVPKQSRPSED